MIFSKFHNFSSIFSKNIKNMKRAFSRIFYNKKISRKMDANSSFFPKNENAKKMWAIVMTTPIWKWQKCHCEMKNIQKKNWLRSFTSTLQKCQPSLIWFWWAAIVMTRRHFYIIYSLGRKYLKNGGRHYYKLVHRNNLIPLL